MALFGPPMPTPQPKTRAVYEYIPRNFARMHNFIDPDGLPPFLSVY
ncbi:MAG: hypothetical protein O4860_00025 [Trichodesmium sp. St2_bin2_1]|nr:hypothetical protein [Trichodesmium sp. St2_bin2_1]